MPQTNFYHKKSYKKVKKKCYPQPEDIKVTSTYAEVSLQALFGHTVERLFFVQKPVIDSLQENELDKFILYSEWGLMVSSGHSSPKGYMYYRFYE